MSEPSRIGIILGTTRTGRFADKPADWLLRRAARRTTARFERIDLRDYPLPFFDEPKSPLREPPKNEIAKRWADKLGSLDAFVFVTGEYNRSIPGVLKNALDYVYPELNRKPAAFLAYGGAGGVRAIEHLRMMLVELQVAPSRYAVHLGRHEYLDVALHGKSIDDFPHLGEAADAMLDDLLWWTETLRAGRAASRPPV